jgi:RNA polymerase sigma-70 factor (ECF subfamily)
VARNLALRAHRTERRTPEPVPPEQLDLASVLPPTDQLDTGALLRCLAALEHRGQTVLMLSFYRDKSADEIAAVLATTAGNVRVLRHRAVAQLRDCMEAS